MLNLRDTQHKTKRIIKTRRRASALTLRFVILAGAVCVFILSACNQKLPEGVIDEQKMVNVLADLHTIDGYMSTMRFTDSVRESGAEFYAAVYKHHHINRAIFEKSLKYYSKDLSLLDSLYNQADDTLKAREAKLYKIQEDQQRKMMQSK